MIRSALRLCAGITLAACFACAPMGQAPAPPPPAATVAVKANFCHDAQSFGQAAWLIKEPYNASTMADPTPTTQPDSAIQQSLADAYKAAPPFLQDELCGQNGKPGLDGIFITTQPDSWGFRNSRDPANVKRYIGLSTSLWSAGTPIPLATQQNRVFVALNWPPAPANPPPPPPPPTDPSPPNYLDSIPPGGAATILAALAHEYGHVLWADVLILAYNTPPLSSRFCQKILDESWTGGPMPHSATWTPFGDTDPNPADGPPDLGDPAGKETKILKLQEALRNGDIPKAHKILERILKVNHPFPSLLGAFSANEQFVETYMLYTLTKARPPLTSLRLQVSPGSVTDIPETLASRAKLMRVMNCFDYIVAHY